MGIMKTPLHTILRQYRVWQTAATVCLIVNIFQLIAWMTASPYKELSDWHLAPITATLPALVAGTFKLIEIMMRKNEIDDHDKT